MACKVIELNKPNYKLVAKALIRLVEANEVIEERKIQLKNK